MNDLIKMMEIVFNQKGQEDKIKMTKIMMILDKMDILTKVKTTKQRQRNGVKLNFLGGIDMPT